MMQTLPDSTHWNPSRKSDNANIGMIFSTYLITSSSLLYNFPQTCRTRMVVVPTITPSKMAIPVATHIAIRAHCGRPAPNSFETRVLWYLLEGMVVTIWYILNKIETKYFRRNVHIYWPYSTTQTDWDHIHHPTRVKADEKWKKDSKWSIHFRVCLALLLLQKKLILQRKATKETKPKCCLFHSSNLKIDKYKPYR